MGSATLRLLGFLAGTWVCVTAGLANVGVLNIWPGWFDKTLLALALLLLWLNMYDTYMDES